MEVLQKWNLKISTFLEENQELGHKIRQLHTFVMSKVDAYPRLALIFFIIFLFLIILHRPWILIVTSLSVFMGFHSIDFLHKNLTLIVSYIQTQRAYEQNAKKHKNDGDGEEETTTMRDPLLNNYTNNIVFAVGSQNEELRRSGSVTPESQKKSEHENSPEVVKAGSTAKTASSRLKINAKLDKSIAHFCSIVFDAYITPDWAPYETRKQLKLAFVKLLTSFTDRVIETFVIPRGGPEDDSSKCYGVSFCRDKIIPLVFLHFQNGHDRQGQPLSPMKMKRSLWKVRRLCRTLLEAHLTEIDQSCLLWMELCVSVLADGVLWNLILLGRTELPILLEQIVMKQLLYNGQNITKSSSTSQSEQPKSSKLNAEHHSATTTTKADGNKNIDETDDTKAKSGVEIRIQGSDKESHDAGIHLTNKRNSTGEASIPFLLDNFLDPSHDVEQAAMIVSRWRPTLNDILNERELLYALIQYLRGQKALEFLQAVLDDSPDGRDYCRKILELEYLPGFCRSRIFLESLGLNRIDEVGLEAGTEAANTFRKPVGHTRSASYGNEPGTKLWKFDKSVVEGIAILNDRIPQSIPFQDIGSSETTDSIFSKRRHVLEAFIIKFFKSTNNFGARVVDPLGEKVTARRLGIDSKDYEDFFHSEVTSSVQIAPCDILAETIKLVTSRMFKVKWLKWIGAGWLKLLHPFLKPKFDSCLDNRIAELLSVTNCIKIVDLISGAFLQSTLMSPPDNLSEQHADSSKQGTENNTGHLASGFSHNFLGKCVTEILQHVFDIKGILAALDQNGDEFILFCVDLLDILVADLTPTNSELNTKTLNLNQSPSMHSLSPSLEMKS